LKQRDQPTNEGKEKMEKNFRGRVGLMDPVTPLPIDHSQTDDSKKPGNLREKSFAKSPGMEAPEVSCRPQGRGGRDLKASARTDNYRKGTAVELRKTWGKPEKGECSSRRSFRSLGTSAAGRNLSVVLYFVQCDRTESTFSAKKLHKKGTTNDQLGISEERALSSWEGESSSSDPPQTREENIGPKTRKKALLKIFVERLKEPARPGRLLLNLVVLRLKR